jgi:hypothetical protein
VQKLHESASLKEINEATSDLLGSIGEEVVDQSIRHLEAKFSANPLLRDHITETSGLVLGISALFDHISARGSVEHIDSRVPWIFESIAFVVATHRKSKLVDARQREVDLRRVMGGMQNHADLRALHFELMTAVHASRRGFDIDFPKSESSPGPEFLARDNGIALQVECKLISCDKGRSIHRIRALEIFGRLHALTEARAWRGPDLFVDILLRRKPCGSSEETRSIIDTITQAITQRANKVGENALVTLSAIAEEGTIAETAATDQMSLRRLVAKWAGNNTEHLVAARRNQAGFIFRLRCEKPDKVLEEIFKTLKKSRSRQLHPDVPAVFWVKLESLSGKALALLGTEGDEPSALRFASSRFLNSQRSTGVVALVFCADGEVESLPGDLASRRGTTYYFTDDKAPQGVVQGLQKMLD